MIKQNTEEWLQGPTLGIWIREVHVHLTVSVETELTVYLSHIINKDSGSNEESFRERVQISASGHTDADQMGNDWMSDPILSVPNETESAMGLNSLSGQLTKVVKKYLAVQISSHKSKKPFQMFQMQFRMFVCISYDRESFEWKTAQCTLQVYDLKMIILK